MGIQTTFGGVFTPIFSNWGFFIRNPGSTFPTSPRNPSHDPSAAGRPGQQESSRPVSPSFMAQKSCETKRSKVGFFLGMPVNLREVPGNSLQKRSKGFRKIAHTITLPVPQAAQITFLQPNNTKVLNRTPHTPRLLGPCHSMPFECYPGQSSLVPAKHTPNKDSKSLSKHADIP